MAEARQEGRREVGRAGSGEKEEAKTTARGKQMSRKIMFGEKKSKGSSFIRRPPASLFGNDEEEKEEEEEEDEGEGEEKDEEQDEEEDEEEEEEEVDDGRKGWSD